MKKNNLFKTAALLLMMVLPMLVATNVNAQTGGSSCETATALTGNLSTISTNLAEGTDFQYYSFTPQTNGVYYVKSGNITFGDSEFGNLHLSVSEENCYSGIAKGTADATTGNLLNETPFYAYAGKIYYFKWSSWSGGASFTWEITKAPNQNNYPGYFKETAKPLTDVSNSITNNPHSGNNDNWYSFTPTAAQAGVYILKLNSPAEEHSGIYLSIYENNDGYAASGSDGNDPYRSKLFYAESGNTYYFEWSSYSLVEPYTWEFAKATQAESGGLFCQTAIVATVQNNILLPFNDKKTSALYYSFTPSTAGVYTISNCGKSPDGPRELFVSTDCNRDENIVNIGTSCTGGTKLSFDAVVGTTYYIQWYNDNGSSNRVNSYFDITKETNPVGLTCQTAITQQPSANITTVNGVTWYRFTPAQNGYYTATNYGKTTDTTEVLVLSDCQIAIENLINQDYYDWDEGEIAQSKVTFYAETTKQYYIIWENESDKNNSAWSLSAESNPQYATGIEVDSEQDNGDDKRLELGTNEQGNLYYEIRPVGNAYKDLKWESRNTSVATVNSAGKVTGVSSGSTYVVLSVTAGANTLKDSCLVLVAGATIEVTGIKLSPKTIAAEVGETGITIDATTTPTGAPMPALNWVSRNTTIASIAYHSGSYANIYANAEGSTYIVATTADGKFADSCLVTVTAPVALTGISVAPKTTSLAPNANTTLTASPMPANAKLPNNLVWQSRNSAIATVDNSGKVTAVAEGTVYIVATTQEGEFSDSCLVTVSNSIVAVTGITVSPATLSLKTTQTGNLSATVLPENATNKDYTWSSQNTAIATVTQTGVVTAVGVGSTYIVAKTEEGEFEAKSTVTVTLLGIDPVTGKEKFLVVYPNPTNEKLVIKNEEWATAKTVDIYNSVGGLVATYKLTGEITEINISHLPSGVYLVKVGNETVKIIKR